MPEVAIAPPLRKSLTPEHALSERPLVHPEHLFHSVEDAMYAPPQSRNVGALEKVLARKTEPAYRTMPAIHDLKIAVDIYNRALGTPLIITCQELLSLAPEVRAQLREAISSRCIPTKDSAMTLMMHELSLTDEDLSYLLEHEIALFDQPPASVSIGVLSKPRVSLTNLPEDAIIIMDDSIDQYYWNLKLGEEPDLDKLIVAVESSMLCSLILLINNTSNVKCVLDPECQIIAMSEDVPQACATL